MIFEKCGFAREGLIRQGKMVSTWCDYYVYGLLDMDLPGQKGHVLPREVEEDATEKRTSFCVLENCF